MPHVLPNRSTGGMRIRRPAVLDILNNDGGRHRLENSLAVTAIVLGLCVLVLGFIPRTHLFGAIGGVVGLPLAVYSQLISATTGERWLNVVGMIASFVGLGFALRHGGFVP